MSKLNVYDLEKYKSLSSLKDANNELNKKESEFNELLAKVIALTERHNIELGLRLIHGHDIPLEDGQAMVEKFDNYQDEPALITSATVPNGKAYPASWILCDDKYLVFEYSTDLRVKQVYERLLENSFVLDEISTHIRQYKLDSLIGPCIIARDTMSKFNTKQGQGFIEDTFKIEDKYANIIQSKPITKSCESIKTLWGVKVNDFCLTILPFYCCKRDS
ncbi:6084_t:CDS:1 [Cetraspora pellucida]|uniref:6084_t:CDS:1 n=1 Tax=Cetraspora pellucida TaxID=1433469 RepID=A0ACA9JZ25_9GLOM|nr:6084_t:CDS:1 [Cetraspora pellucida]